MTVLWMSYSRKHANSRRNADVSETSSIDLEGEREAVDPADLPDVGVERPGNGSGENALESRQGLVQLVQTEVELVDGRDTDDLALLHRRNPARHEHRDLERDVIAAERHRGSLDALRLPRLLLVGDLVLLVEPEQGTPIESGSIVGGS